MSSLLGIFIDPFIIIATLLAATLIEHEEFGPPYVVLSVIVFSISFPGQGRFREKLGKVARELLLSWLSMAFILFFFGYASGYLHHFPQRILLHWLVVTPFALIVGHSITRILLRHILSQQDYQKKAIIVGMSEIGLRLAHHLHTDYSQGIRLIGFFDDRERQRLPEAERQTLLGQVKQLAGFVKENHIDIIYIALPMAAQPRILCMLDDLRDTTTSIYFAPDIFITDLIQGRLDNVNGIPVVGVCETPFSGINGFIKRGSDIVLSLLILILISPVMLAIAICIKLTSPGPILFRQRRYGLDGLDIIVYKFRSMTVAEDGDTIVQATKNDRRITPLGAFLRKTSLDELPQFINVIQGRMSIVGPRPHAIAHNELYRKLIKGYMIRHKVKPGITGWAQVNGFRGETETVEKMQKRIDYDLDYLRNWSLGMDLWVILKTVFVVVGDRNAY